MIYSRIITGMDAHSKNANNRTDMETNGIMSRAFLFLKPVILNENIRMGEIISHEKSKTDPIMK